MDRIQEADANNISQHSSSSVVALAIKGNKKSKYVVQWALNKFVPEGMIVFKLIHVHAGIKGVPTPMGNVIPLSQVRNDVATAFKKEVEWQINQMLLPFKRLCEQRKVHVDVVVIESDDVATAIAEEVAKGVITKLIVGASSRGIFKSKHKGMSAKISACTPRFCTIYAVSKGKLSIRPSDMPIDGSIIDDASETSFSSSSSSNYHSTSQTESTSVSSYAGLHSSSLATQRFQALSSINHSLLSTTPCLVETNHSRGQSLDLGRDTATSSARNSDIDHSLSRVSSCKSFISDTESWVHDQISGKELTLATSLPSPNRQAKFNLELEKLRIELRHAQGLHAVAQSEKIEASRKLNDLTKRRTEETMKMKEIIAKEEKAIELAKLEKEKYQDASREAEYLKECADREAAERKETELKAIRAAKEKEKLEDALSGSMPQYRKFTWDEIVSATSSFSEDLKIGMGAYGIVYKCSLYHTTVAVKVLKTNENCESKQFQQELEILSRIRHPNLLLLLGACPDHGCLVYEYMENGNLEDSLLRKNNTAPIPWFERFRIAWEVASALAFLHSSKPEPIIHRDLKPANILLGRNLVSKIGDIGLSTVLHSDNLSTMYNDTGPVGTLCYIDPEYQRTGSISPKSDVYAFGMVILQLLTAKPAIALAHKVETAIDGGNLTDILDPEAGSWSFQETLDLALLGLSCAELRRRDRPDLQDHVLPTLERLKEVVDRAQHSSSIVTIKSKPPNHFICPILQDVMDDPCVAADGYTYDRKAIEKWLQENDKSPMTNMALPHKHLIPNYTLLSAILEWKSRES
ncbi:U-box domain-containing protein 35 isoform X1 [Cajanus cajan]|uniref:U-box domain-containing protein 35 isoform X1 n=1 Tax=Cajanus cajan TaxID=3821 RepID=UPI00098D8107|nr:U-box domain-containing protein 35 isoform X1 [Cajanus cajan]XP_020240251.1 U-box domain-containing protein 35 isoform X1 [Cajanus cajan]